MMIRLKATLTAASALLAGVALFTSCKGRTMDNMEPTGDTVEVVVEEPDAPAPVRVMPADSAAASLPADSAAASLPADSAAL